MKTITRFGFCPTCFANKQPKTGTLYMVHNSVHGIQTEPKQMKAKRNGRTGIVPTLYRIEGFGSNKAYYQTLCSICGYEKFELPKKREDDEQEYKLVELPEMWSNRMYMSVRNWDALEDFKDTGFEI